MSYHQVWIDDRNSAQLDRLRTAIQRVTGEELSHRELCTDVCNAGIQSLCLQYMAALQPLLRLAEAVEGPNHAA